MNMHSEWFDVLRRIIDIKEDRAPVRIPVRDRLGQEVGHLSPLTVRHLGDEELIATFVRWRNQNLSGNLDQRPVTLAGTRVWLEQTVLEPLRMAFLIYHGERMIGRCGFVHLTPQDHEADGLVRGERGGGMNFLFDAQVAGLDWIFRHIRSGSVMARVLNTNDLALANCRRMGYDLDSFESTPLYRRVTAEGAQLLPTGRDDELVPGLVVYSIRLGRDAFYQANAERLAATSAKKVP